MVGNAKPSNAVEEAMERLGVVGALGALAAFGYKRPQAVEFIKRALRAGVQGEGEIVAWVFQHRDDE
jgi:hypothetical protein